MSTPRMPLVDVSKLPVDEAVEKLLDYALMLPASDIFFANSCKTRTICS